MAAFSYEDSLLFDVTHINKYVGVFYFKTKSWISYENISLGVSLLLSKVNRGYAFLTIFLVWNQRLN